MFGAGTAFYCITDPKGRQIKKEEVTMKRIAARLFETAIATFSAVLLLTSGAPSASAQSLNLKGSIPFAFSANRADLTPGTYQIRQVSQTSNPTALALYNPATQKTVFVPVVDRIVNAGGVAPHAEFSCDSNTCQLVKVYDGVTGFELVHPRSHSAEQERLLAVNLDSGRR
jgi:hypothetical protein